MRDLLQQELSSIHVFCSQSSFLKSLRLENELGIKEFNGELFQQK